MKRMNSKTPLIACIFWLLSVLWGLPAAAKSPPPRSGGSGRAGLSSRASVKLIQASEKKGRFPKELARLKHQLTRPPFSAFKSFKVLKTLSFTLDKGRSVTAVLAGPYVLSLTLLNKVTAAKGKVRYRFQLVLSSKRGRRVRLLHKSRMLLDKGGTFFLAGPRYKARTLILGITLR